MVEAPASIRGFLGGRSRTVHASATPSPRHEAPERVVVTGGEFRTSRVWTFVLQRPRVPNLPAALLEEWLKPMKLTQLALAKKMGVDFQLVNGEVLAQRPLAS